MEETHRVQTVDLLEGGADAAGDIEKAVRIVRGTRLSGPPGQLPITTPAEEPSQTSYALGPYRILARFRSGATSHVFLAEKHSPFGSLGQAVVKFASRSSENYEEQHDLLIDEGRALARLNHANIVKLQDIVEGSEGTYLAVEYVPGRDLRDVLTYLYERRQKMPAPIAGFVVVEILRALEHAHAAADGDGRALGIVHRDVNPSNVLMSAEGAVKLTDFGLVHMRGRVQEPTAPRVVKGKFRYLAPEYIETQILTASADIYGAGLILYELLTGEFCFAGDNDAVRIMRSIVREGVDYSFLESVAPAMAQVVVRATSRKPNERHASAAEMRQALEGAMAGMGYVSASHLSKFVVEALA